MRPRPVQRPSCVAAFLLVGGLATSASADPLVLTNPVGPEEPPAPARPPAVPGPSGGAQIGAPPAGAPAPPAPPAAGRAVAAAVRTPAPPSFEKRYQVRGGIDFGWNSLTGLGGTLGATLLPHVEVDGGVGISALGWRAGARLRLTPFTGPLRPFVGGGLSLSLGTLGKTVKIDSDDNVIRYKVGVSPFAQLVGGLEYLDDSGWVFQLTAGRAFSLRADNVTVTEGTANQSQRDVLRLLYRSGLMLSIGIGKRFD